MSRRLARLAVVLALLLLVAYGLYEWLSPTPQPPPAKPPEHTGTATHLPATASEWEELARTNPVALLDNALTQYRRTVKGFTATLEKQERIAGELHDPEVLRLAVQGDVPEAGEARPNIKSRMVWDQGARKVVGFEVRATLYVEGSNNNQIWTFRPGALLKERSVDPKESNARSASRYCMRDSGLYQVMLRTYTAWDRSAKAGELKVGYDGLKPVEKLGGRPCHVIRRTCPRPEADPFAMDEEPPTDPKVVERDGFTEVTIYVDAEWWIQTGTELRQGTDLIGAYYYRDLELNPTLAPNTFTTAAAKAAVKK
jgi:hypothetical protein